ncbi:hypothetical protein [Tolypothrix sp. FACHB-123]|nr:hypothetical protein [Tolypothrix sp. FACHB-123]
MSITVLAYTVIPPSPSKSAANYTKPTEVGLVMLAPGYWFLRALIRVN